MPLFQTILWYICTWKWNGKKLKVKYFFLLQNNNLFYNFEATKSIFIPIVDLEVSGKN